MGKSTAVSDLLSRLHTQFKLVICFVGSAACNPILKMQLGLWYDPRFFFSEWNAPLMSRLLQQQEELKARVYPQRINFGRRRRPHKQGGGPAKPLRDAWAALQHISHVLQCELHKYSQVLSTVLGRTAPFQLPDVGGPTNVDVGVYSERGNGPVRGEQPW